MVRISSASPGRFMLSASIFLYKTCSFKLWSGKEPAPGRPVVGSSESIASHVAWDAAFSAPLVCRSLSRGQRVRPWASHPLPSPAPGGGFVTRLIAELCCVCLWSYCLNASHPLRRKKILCLTDECQTKYGNANAWRYCTKVFDMLTIAAVSVNTTLQKYE